MAFLNRYIYGLFVEGVPKYIGVGTGARLGVHMKLARRGIIRENPDKCRFLIECVTKGVVVEERKLHEELPLEDALTLEVGLIAKIGRMDLGTGPLLNRSAGGSGSRDPAPSVREKIRLRVFSDEHRRKMREARAGWKHSAETRLKIGESGRKFLSGASPEYRFRLGVNRGKTFSPATLAKMSEAAKRRGGTRDSSGRYAAGISQ